MALQDSLSAASISLTRAQSTLDYIFDALVGSQKMTGNDEGLTSYTGINGNSQKIAERMEQLESQLIGLRDLLVTATPPETQVGVMSARNYNTTP